MEGHEMPREKNPGPAGGRVLNKFLRDRRGAAAAEFALILPVFISMMFGSMEFSVLLYSYSSMQTAARDAARQVAVNSLTPTEAKNKLAAKMPKWMSGDTTVSITQTAPADPSSNIIQVNVSVPANQASPITLFTRGTTWTLSTQAEMKQELPFGKL